MRDQATLRLDFSAPHTAPNLFYRAHTLLGERTPIHADCGCLCGGACCKGGPSEGMLLFPGEEDFYQKLCALRPDAADGFTFSGPGERRLLLCGGSCERAYRPLACRIFPLFPALYENGRVQVILDPRAVRVCPMAKTAARLDRSFIRAVRRVGRLLAADSDCRAFLLEQTRELEELRRLIPMEKGWRPVRYR